MPEVFYMTPTGPDKVIVGTSKKKLIDANSRKGLVIINTSDSAIVSIAFGEFNPKLYEGITLYPHQAFVMNEFAFSFEKVMAISSAEGTVVGIQEFI